MVLSVGMKDEMGTRECREGTAHKWGSCVTVEPHPARWAAGDRQNVRGDMVRRG